MDGVIISLNDKNKKLCDENSEYKDTVADLAEKYTSLLILQDSVSDLKSTCLVLTEESKKSNDKFTGLTNDASEKVTSVFELSENCTSNG